MKADMDRVAAMLSALAGWSLDEEQKANDRIGRAVGETLMAAGGLDLMLQVLDKVIDRHGGKVASWVERRWDGISGASGRWIA